MTRNQLSGFRAGASSEGACRSEGGGEASREKAGAVAASEELRSRA